MTERLNRNTIANLALVGILACGVSGSAYARQSDNAGTKPAGTASGTGQVVASTSQPPKHVVPGGPAHKRVFVPGTGLMPTGPKQLHPMFLDQKLFTPDKWWGYEEADDDRPAEYSVEQEGKVSLGGRFEPNHGGQVTYHVTVLASAAAAHDYFLRMANATKTMKSSSPISFKTVKKGDEAYSTDNTVIVKGTAAAFARNSMVRFGKYIVTINSNANMRALGPRPAQGERRWLCEPVYDAVFDAAMNKWAKYKSLLSGKK